jgi:hypothetical protein
MRDGRIAADTVPVSRPFASGVRREYVAMIFEVTIETTEDGACRASSADPMASALGLSAASALEKLRAEIRYRIEMCPCSSVEDDYVQLRVAGDGH